MPNFDDDPAPYWATLPGRIESILKELHNQEITRTQAQEKLIDLLEKRGLYNAGKDV